MKKILLYILVFLIFLLDQAAEVEKKPHAIPENWDFAMKKLWEIKGTPDMDFVQVQGLKTDINGRIFINDLKYMKFFVFDTNGKFRYSFGSRGEGPGEFKFPLYFSLVNAQLIVHDMGKIHFFSNTGKYIRSIPLVRFQNKHPHRFIDTERYISITSSKKKSKGLEIIEIVNMKTGISIPLASIQPVKPMELSLKTQSGNIRLTINDPSTKPAVVVGLGRNRIYYGKNDQYHIKMADYDGKNLGYFFLSGRTPTKISSAFKKKRVKAFRFNGKEPPPAMARQMIENMPDHCTYFNRIVEDSNGFIYVFVTDIEQSHQRKIDIFSPKSRHQYQGIISIPKEHKLSLLEFDFKRNHLYILFSDQDDEEKLAKYKIKTPTKN